MRREQTPGPGQDGEERGSSPSSFSGKGKAGRKRPGGREQRENARPGKTGPSRAGRASGANSTGGNGGPARDSGAAEPEQPVRPAGSAGPERLASLGRPTGPTRPTVAARFTEGGAADVMAPSASLVGLVTAVTGSDGT